MCDTTVHLHIERGPILLGNIVKPGMQGSTKLWNYRLLDGVRAVASQESVSIVTSQRIHYSLARRVMMIVIKSDQVGL